MSNKLTKVGKLSTENAHPKYVVIYQNNNNPETVVIVKHNELAAVVAQHGLNNIVGCYELGSKLKVDALTISVSAA